MVPVGYFEISSVEDRPGWWLLRNTFTGVEHKSPGTWEEIVNFAEVQSRKWDKRLAKGKGVTEKGTFQRPIAGTGKVPGSGNVKRRGKGKLEGAEEFT